MVGGIEFKAISANVEVGVEVEAELGKNKKRMVKIAVH